MANQNVCPICTVTYTGDDARLVVDRNLEALQNRHTDVRPTVQSCLRCYQVIQLDLTNRAAAANGRAAAVKAYLDALSV